MKNHFWIVTFCLVISGSVAEASNKPPTCPLQRDSFYEQSLRYQAAADKAMTPARAFHWIRSLMGSSVDYREPNTEFRPVVTVRENQGVRILATIAYKF